MRPISFKRHRFLPEVIRDAVWPYFRFTLSFRDVEERCCQSNDNSSPGGQSEPKPTRALSQD